MRLSRQAAIFILTGAGISAETGLPTFRGAGGLWRAHRAQDVATPEAFAAQPELVHAFYNARRQRLQDPAIAPNRAHLALARLERRWPGRFDLVTQNVDDLHQRAGSTAALHMHGQLLRSRCTGCGQVRSCLGNLGTHSMCADCGRVGGLRPDIVWFGEMPIALERIYAALEACDLFAAIGTSGQVQPAAAFVASAAAAGAHTVEINLEPGSTSTSFAEHRFDPASQLVPAFVDELLGLTESA